MYKLSKFCFKSIRIAVVACTLACSVSAAAVDLPVKTIAGKEYFYYVAKQGDTALKVSGALGISSSQLLKYNPWAEDGLRINQTLYFPVDEFSGNFGRASAEADLTTSNDVSENAPSHVVGDGETLFGIARKYNVTPDKIVDLNPWAASGVHKGQRLILPIPKSNTSRRATEKDKKDESKAQTQQKKGPQTAKRVEPIKDDNELTPVNPPVAAVPSEDPESNPVTVPVAEAPTTEVSTPVAARKTIAVVLPFGLESAEHSKRSALATDFYRGLLLAADTLRNTSSPIDIKVLDAGTSADDTRRLLKSDALQGADIIIGPSDADQFDLVAEYGRRNNKYVINSFIVKDSTYLTNPYVVQTYIDQSTMYDKAADFALSLISSNPGTVPVLLENKHGDHNKEELVGIIISRLKAEGITPVTITYDGNLTLSELKESLSPQGKYLFIPNSGSLKEFNRFAHPIVLFATQETDPAEGKVMMFGFPEWTAFRGTPRENLSKIGANIYSRFYADPASFTYQGVNDAYKHWFGRELPSEVPVQALLGFDTAAFLINTLSTYGADMSKAPSYQGVQSTFDFKPTANGGLLNNALYTIEYLPGDAVNINIR